MFDFTSSSYFAMLCDIAVVILVLIEMLYWSPIERLRRQLWPVWDAVRLLSTTREVGSDDNRRTERFRPPISRLKKNC